MQHEMEGGGIYWAKTGMLRGLQAANPNGIVESKPCVPFENILRTQITNEKSSAECSTNSCSGGCCRGYDYLTCDKDNSLADDPCVCNSLTWPVEQWTRAPTPPPVSGAAAAPSVAPAPTPTPTELPISPPDKCPILKTTCETVRGTRIPCTEITIPADPTSPDCNVTVADTYTLINQSTNTSEQLYSLAVNRNNRLNIITNLADIVPVVVLAPNETRVIEGFHEVYNVCTEKGLDVFDAKLDIAAGPSATSLNIATCVTDEGQNCTDLVRKYRRIDCLLNVTHRYTIQNTAPFPYNIIMFNVTRGGQTRDLVGRLEATMNTLVPVNGSLFIEEKEEVDQCKPIPNFLTALTLRNLPRLGYLCDATFYYPFDEIPDRYPVT